VEERRKAQEQVEVFREFLDRSETSLKEASIERDQLEGQLTKLRSEREQLCTVESLTDAEQRLVESERLVGKLSAELSGLRQSEEQRARRAADMEVALEQLREEARCLRGQLEASSRDRRDMGQQLRARRGEVEALQDQLKAAADQGTQDKARYEEACQALRRDKAELDSK
jgi:chromosome segregation ATPase